MGLVDNQSTIPQEEEIVDIQLVGAKKKKFRLNGDNSKIIELNVSDLGIYNRLKEGYEEIGKILNEIANTDVEGEDKFDNMSAALKKADDAMRAQIDYIFDSNISEICCGKGGTMYDPIDGAFRCEIILDVLTGLYSDNLNSEYKKMKARVKQHTDKYLTSDHQKSTKSTRSKKG